MMICKIRISNFPDAPQPSLFGYVDVDGLENDEEWRTMTEEEESLALEENSLHLEIKHVRLRKNVFLYFCRLLG